MTIFVSCTLIVAVRDVANVFGAAVMDRVPEPTPLAADSFTHAAVVVADHGHFAEAVMVAVAVPPPTAKDEDAGVAA
jgi:hypothetical protein